MTDRVPDRIVDDLASLAPSGVAPSGDEHLGVTASTLRIHLAFAALGALALILLARAADLGIARSPALRSLAEGNRLRTTITPAQRGGLMDRHGRTLVQSTPRFSIGIAPIDLPIGAARDAVIGAIADAIGTTPAAVTAAIDPYPPSLAEPIPVTDPLPYDAAIRAYAASPNGRTHLLVTNERAYRGADGRELTGQSHVLGYVGRVHADEYPALARTQYRPDDRIGRSGIEASYEDILRGAPGVRVTTIDVHGRAIGDVAEERASAGATIVLATDRDVTAVADRALREGIRAAGGSGGVAIMLDAENGDVLTMVSAPSFSNTALGQGVDRATYAALTADPRHPLFPRAVAGRYPAGSTIKPFIAAMALRKGAVTPTTTIRSTGGIRIGPSFFPDWKSGGHGAVDIVEALAWSVNTYFYVIGGGWPTGESRVLRPETHIRPLGPVGLAEALHAFGFGVRTGIDLPDESPGLIPTPVWKEQTRGEPWYIGDTYHLAIGQGDLLVTPLQVARATAAIANGGFLVTPRVVLGRWDGTAIQRHPPRAVVPIAGQAADAIRTVRTGMRAAVTRGSARRLGALPFLVYGKTGTAQTAPGKRTHAWFTGFAEPPNVRCQVSGVRCRTVVITVLVEEGGEGSIAAVPIAHTILSAWAATPVDKSA